jgi:hypothetical protein
LLKAMTAAALDDDLYELDNALATALSGPDIAERWWGDRIRSLNAPITPVRDGVRRPPFRRKSTNLPCRRIRLRL